MEKVLLNEELQISTFTHCASLGRKNKEEIGEAWSMSRKVENFTQNFSLKKCR